MWGALWSEYEIQGGRWVHVLVGSVLTLRRDPAFKKMVDCPHYSNSRYIFISEKNPREKTQAVGVRAMVRVQSRKSPKRWLQIGGGKFMSSIRNWAEVYVYIPSSLIGCCKECFGCCLSAAPQPAVEIRWLMLVVDGVDVAAAAAGSTVAIHYVCSPLQRVLSATE